MNEELVRLYWDIGKTIVEKQQNGKWGDSTVKQLSKDLQSEFYGIKGFPPRNLASMKKIYLEYKDNESLQQLVAKIPWGHNIEVVQKCKNLKQREFYIRMIVRRGWFRAILLEKVRNNEFEKWVTSQNNFRKTLSSDLACKGEVIVKDNYTSLKTKHPISSFHSKYSFCH